MPVRIVAADQSEARFYDLAQRNRPLRLVGRLEDPRARLHDRDFNSDRPGRVFDHAPPAVGRRGSVPRHSTDGERKPRKHEAQLFARRVAGALDRARRKGEFESIVVIAGAPFLGLLREAFSGPTRKAVLATIAKNLVHHPESELRDHLAERVFMRRPAVSRTALAEQSPPARRSRARAGNRTAGRSDVR